MLTTIVKYFLEKHIRTKYKKILDKRLQNPKQTQEILDLLLLELSENGYSVLQTLTQPKLLDDLLERIIEKHKTKKETW